MTVIPKKSRLLFSIISYARAIVNLFSAREELFRPRDVAFFKEIRYNGGMLKIWAKVYRDDRIAKQTTYENEEKFTYANFFKYLADICGELDIPTPVLLKTHLFNYAKFRHVVFRPRDFLESVDFEKLVLENLL